MGNLQAPIKAKTVTEIDRIIPLIKKLHAFSGIDKYTSLTGYLIYLTSNLPNDEMFGLWYWNKEDGEPEGFLVAQVQVRMLQLECTVVDVYMKDVDTEMSDNLYRMVVEWAKNRKCKYLTCLSNRPEALSRKYGFDKYGTLMMREI